MVDALKRRYDEDAKFRRLFQGSAWAAIGLATVMIGGHFVATMRYVEAMDPKHLFVRASASPSADAPAPAVGPRRVPMPDEVRGIYMTSHSAGSKPIRDGLVAYIERNGLNAVVIDVKDANGRLSFMPERDALAEHAPSKPAIPDLDEFLDELGEKGIYRIARLFVFQDPNYVALHPERAVQHVNGGIWRDHKGIPWVDPSSKEAWDYAVELSREAHARGFDEIQLDYIRFPSDGNMRAVKYANYDGSRPKHEVLAEFFRYVHDALERRGIPVSYDLFGFVTWHWGKYDLGIGQMMEDAVPYGTAVSPMVYPSHYPPGTLGFANPAAHPYEIVSDSLRKANGLYAKWEEDCAAGSERPIMPCDAPKLAHQRPWLQAFDIGATYTSDKYWAQIRAAREQGAKGWLFWNARNVYRDFNVRQ